MEERFSKKRGREDIISNLPDSLISQVLSYLSTKEAVKTTVLSNRWKSLWLLISELDLESSEFPDYNAFARFMDKFLDFCREEKSCLHKVKLRTRKGKNDPPCVTRWIDFVATPKLEHFDFECGPLKREYLELMPLSLYKCCQKLLHLRLHRVLLGKFESVYIPCLKTLRLENNAYADDACLELLISSCPVLEDLSIVRRGDDDDVKVLRVHSQTLTSLSIEVGGLDFDPEGSIDEYDDKSLRLLIDVPRLKYLNLNDDISECRTISNLGSLTKVNLLRSFYTTDSHDEVPDHFFTSISGVRDLKIDDGPFVVIKVIMPLPQLCNLSCLEAELHFWYLDMVPTFLEICPNLRSLILDLHCSSVMHRPRFSFVPQCLLSSLEFVEIESSFNIDPIEMELVRYFAENSLVLKKLALRLNSSMGEEDSVVFRDLLTLLRRSSTCQIVLC